jgi:hypothetical protein
MRLQLRLSLATVTLILSAAPSSAALISWWNFNDGSGATAADASPSPVGGSANNGTLTNFTGSYWNANLTGSTDGITMPHGLYFAGGANGANGAAPLSPLVNLTAHLSDFLTLGTGTISVWYRADKTPVSSNVDEFTFLAIGTGANGAYNRIIIQDALHATPANRLLVKTDHNGTTATQTTSNYVNTNDGNWHNLMYSSDGTTSQFYIDGIAVGAAGATKFLDYNPGAPSTPFTSMLLGAAQRNTATGAQTLWYFKGTMGDFRIYDTVLTADERTYVATVANYGNGLVPEPGTCALAGISAFGVVLTARKMRRKSF